MTKRGIKLNFHLPRGVKNTHTHIKRRGKNKQLITIISIIKCTYEK